MDYYRVLYSSEYAKKNGKFRGIEIIPTQFDWYQFEDGKTFPLDFFNTLNAKVDYKKENKILADYPMVYIPCWRLISERMYDILKKFSNEDVEFYAKNVENNGKTNVFYFIHFVKIYDVLDKMKTKLSSEPKIMINNLIYNKHLFVYNDATSAICISSKLKEELEQVPVSGCTYQLI